MSTTTKQCNCDSEYQDKIYGKKIRLMNLRKEGKECKCTVCGKIIKIRD